MYDMLILAMIQKNRPLAVFLISSNCTLDTIFIYHAYLISPWELAGYLFRNDEFWDELPRIADHFRIWFLNSYNFTEFPALGFGIAIPG